MLNKITNRLNSSAKYYDGSKNPDYDDLHDNVGSALKFMEFAYEELEEIMDRDYELGCTPEQLNQKILEKEKERGRRKRNDSGKAKQRQSRKN